MSCCSCTDGEAHAAKISKCPLCGELFCSSHKGPTYHRCKELIKATDTRLDDVVKNLSQKVGKPVWERELFRVALFSRQRERSHRSNPQEEKCLIPQMKYLWLFEGEYTTGIIDTFCMLLIDNGIKLFDKNRRNKEMQNMADLADLSLYKKFDFLKKNGFNGITREDFKFVRDCIAHQNVFIMSEKSLLIPRNSAHIEMRNNACPKDELNIGIKLRELEEFVDEMENKLADIIEKYSPGYKRPIFS